MTSITKDSLRQANRAPAYWVRLGRGSATGSVAEALTNAARHARASQVWVIGSTHGGRVTFEIKDNGVGFESEQVSSLPGRYGLLGLRERARLAGGVLTVESRPGAGTCVHLELPENAGGP